MSNEVQIRKKSNKLWSKFIVIETKEVIIVHFVFITYKFLKTLMILLLKSISCGKVVKDNNIVLSSFFVRLMILLLKSVS